MQPTPDVGGRGEGGEGVVAVPLEQTLTNLNIPQTNLVSTGNATTPVKC